jgi:hypothetical protein
MEKNFNETLKRYKWAFKGSELGVKNLSEGEWMD